MKLSLKMKMEYIQMHIFYEKYYIDYLGNITSREKIIGIWEIDKKIIIQDECDYTK